MGKCLNSLTLSGCKKTKILVLWSLMFLSEPDMIPILLVLKSNTVAPAFRQRSGFLHELDRDCSALEEVRPGRSSWKRRRHGKLGAVALRWRQISVEQCKAYWCFFVCVLCKNLCEHTILIEWVITHIPIVLPGLLHTYHTDFSGWMA
jgi:hypothetical protein